MAATRYQVPVTKYRNIVRAAKVSAVVIFAVGIEFVGTQHVVEGVLLFAVAVLISLWPVKIDISADDTPPEEPRDKDGGKPLHPLEEI